MLKFLGLQSSEEYDTIKSHLKRYSKELQAIGSKELSEDERKSLQHKYRRIVCLAENQNIPAKEAVKLQMAIKKLRKKFRHLGFIDYVCPVETNSAFTMTEPCAEYRNRRPNFRSPEKEHFDYSPQYFDIVSQLANVLISVENSVSFTSDDILIYQLKFETIKESIDDNSLAQEEFEEVSSLYNEYLTRFRECIKMSKTKNRNESKTENKYTHEKNSVTERVSLEVDSWHKSSNELKNPRVSESNESKFEELIKIIDLGTNNFSTSKDKNSSINLDTRSRRSDCKVFESLGDSAYSFGNYNKLLLPNKNEEKGLFGSSFSYDDFMARNCQTNKFGDSNYGRLTNSKISLFGDIGLSRRSQSKEVTTKDSFADEICEAKQQYQENLKTIYYKRLQNFYKSRLDEQDSINRQASFLTEELEKMRHEKNEDMKRYVKLLSRAYSRAEDLEAPEPEIIPTDSIIYDYIHTVNDIAGNKKRGIDYKHSLQDQGLPCTGENCKRIRLDNVLEQDHEGTNWSIECPLCIESQKEQELTQFLDSFNIDSVDNLRNQVDKIDILQKYAKDVASRVNNFDSGKFSLEHFNLGKQLRRLKKKVERLKFPQDRTSAEKRRDLIKYIKRLQIILGERAKSN